METPEPGGTVQDEILRDQLEHHVLHLLREREIVPVKCHDDADHAACLMFATRFDLRYDWQPCDLDGGIGVFTLYPVTL